MKSGGFFLEDGGRFKWPGPVEQPPPAGLRDCGAGLREVGREIGPKKKPGALPCPAGDLFQKSRSQDPVFVVPALRPRIGEKDIDRGKSGVRRQGGQEIDVIGLHEVCVRELGALALAFGALDSLPAYVDAYAMLAAMSRGIGDQEMPVTAAYFPDEFR